MKGQIKQFCVIVGELETSMKNYWEIFGVGPFQKNHFTPETSHDIYVRGKKVEEDYHFCCACAWRGKMEYELIRPYTGPNIYWDHLEAYGPGMHHFKVVIPDDDELKAYMDTMEEKGMKVIQTGWIDQDVHYYIDSLEKLGMIVEFGNGGAIRECTDFYPADRSLKSSVEHVQNIRRISLVVDDLEKYKANWENLMDVNGWTVERHTRDQMEAFEYKGSDAEKVSFLTARAETGGIQLELIQPEEGPSVYADFLESHGPGLFRIVDLCGKEEAEEEIKRLTEAGIPVTQCWKENGGMDCCFDTQEAFSVVMGIGTILEGSC